MTEQAPELPSGTLTLLFSDIEASTRLLQRVGAAWPEVVSAHRAALRGAFAEHHGTELGTEGDSFFVVFRSVSDAVLAAVDAQRRLGTVRWPDGAAVRVRMGLHTGEPLRHEDGYVGLDVHRAARVAGGAHGGQVLVTEATWRIARLRLPGVRFLDLGRHRLKDLPEPEHLFQVVADGLAATFPAVRSLGSPSNLPRPATSLVGREREVAHLTELLTRADVHLVTLTGPAGTGKTRLALEVAVRVQDLRPDGVYFLPAAHVSNEADLGTALAATLGVEGEGTPPAEVLEVLRDRDVLLVLDNLEQVEGAATTVARLLHAGPRVQVLATSRRPLHLAGEHEVPVPPLPLDGPEGSGTAVDLFVARARLVRPDFTLTPESEHDVRDVCRRLDGLPLAVEIVAARSRLLTPHALRRRLDDALDLTGGAVDVPERQHDLRSALEWSHRLLPEDLQAAFRRLAVLVGTVDLEAVSAVTGMDAWDVVPRLVDLSLLGAGADAEGEPTVRLLSTVRLYAASLLARSGEEGAVRRRHADHYLTVARTWCPRLRGSQHVAARDHLERELDNLRAALAWAFGDGTEDALGVGLALCEELSWFWYGCGYQAEGRRWLEAAVEAAGDRHGPVVVSALHGLGVLVLQHGKAERARALFEACLAFLREEGGPAELSRELNSLALAWRALGDPDRAHALLDEAITQARTAGDLSREANAVSNLAALEVDAGHADRAIPLLHRSLELDTALDDAWGQGADHVNLVGALLRAGRPDDAADHLLTHARAAVALGDVDITVDVLALLCALHATRGDAESAARLLGASQTLRDAAELPLPAPDARWLEGVLSAVRGLPDPGRWTAQVTAGAALTPAAALEEGLAALTGSPRAGR